MQFVSRKKETNLYHIIWSFAAILFIAHIWPPGRDETCKRGKGERHVKHIKHLQSPATLGKHIKYVKHIKYIKHIKHLHPPSLGKQYRAPQSLGPQVAHTSAVASKYSPATNLISEEKENIYLFSDAYSPGPLLKSHHSSPPFALESPFILHPCLPSTGGGPGVLTRDRDMWGGGACSAVAGGVRGHLTTRHRHPLTSPICSSSWSANQLENGNYSEHKDVREG